MASEKATEAAKQIIEDRKGAYYYQDSEILVDYLKSALELPTEEATRKAKSIQVDRKGANYYDDEKILARFLDS